MQDIHDIRPPVMVGMDPAQVKLMLMAGAGGLVVVLVVLVIRYLMKKRKATQIQELIPVIPPYDRAVKDLEQLALEPGHDPKAFYFRLGRTVKAYMGAVFGVNCLEMTTQELIRTVKGLNLSQGLKREVADFQVMCDPFRYAPVAPSQDQVQADLARARALVETMEKERGREGEEA